MYKDKTYIQITTSSFSDFGFGISKLNPVGRKVHQCNPAESFHQIELRISKGRFVVWSLHVISVLACVSLVSSQNAKISKQVSW